MDWESVEDLLRKEYEKLDRKESVEELSSWRKCVFQEGKKTRDEFNDKDIQQNIQAQYLALKTQLKLYAKHIDPNTHTHTHTHTHTKQV